MTAARAMIGVIAVTSLLLGRALGAAHTGVPESPAPAAHELTPPSPVGLTDLFSVPDDRRQPGDDVLDAPRYDVYGNEIQEAVGDYRVDRGGGMYESHSPDTEVAHLGPKIS